MIDALFLYSKHRQDARDSNTFCSHRLVWQCLTTDHSPDRGIQIPLDFLRVFLQFYHFYLRLAVCHWGILSGGIVTYVGNMNCEHGGIVLTVSKEDFPPCFHLCEQTVARVT